MRHGYLAFCLFFTWFTITPFSSSTDVVQFCLLNTAIVSEANQLNFYKDPSPIQSHSKADLSHTNLLPETAQDTLRLVGTICTDDKSGDAAIIEDLMNGKQSLYGFGAILPCGETIEGIFFEHILVEKENRKRVLKIGRGPVPEQDDHPVAKSDTVLDRKRLADTGYPGATMQTRHGYKVINLRYD